MPKCSCDRWVLASWAYFQSSRPRDSSVHNYTQILCLQYKGKVLQQQCGGGRTSDGRSGNTSGAQQNGHTHPVEKKILQLTLRQCVSSAQMFCALCALVSALIDGSIDWDTAPRPADPSVPCFWCPLTHWLKGSVLWYQRMPPRSAPWKNLRKRV